MPDPDPPDRSGRVARARGALYGLAIGDALGMPTQCLPRDAVQSLFGRLTWFQDGPDSNEISAGMPAGSVTDDSDQAIIVARALVDGGGRIDQHRLARDLLDWESRMRDAGSLDLLGPSTRRALDAIARGAPIEEAGRWGDTNGAAMRIAGVGVGTPPEPLAALVERVADVSRLTHDTAIAISGASAVAAAVSAGIDGVETAAALAHGLRAAQRGNRYGRYVPGADVPSRIRWAMDLVRDARTEPRALDLISDLIGTGTGTQEAVPAAFALVAISPDDPWRACLLAAELGGDSDTVAAMAGAIAGSTNGIDAFPAAAVELVTTMNDLHLDQLADDLLRLRDG